LLEGKQLARNGADMLFIGGVDAIAPLPSLPVQVLPTGEGTTGQEVVLNKPERSFYAGGSVGIATLVGHEVEAEALGKGRHLGHGNHFSPGSPQHHHMRIVNHDAGWAAGEIPQGFGEKDFTIETLKRRVDLKKQHA